VRKMMILAPVEVQVDGVHCDHDCEFFGIGESEAVAECAAFGTERKSKKLQRNKAIKDTPYYFRCQGCIAGQLLVEKRALRALKEKRHA
jgi:hypothetical protein